MTDEQFLNKPDEETVRASKEQRYRNVFYTYNNPTKEGPDWMEFVNERLPIAFHVVQKEQGEKEGTIHFQGYIEFRSQVRKSQIITALGTHFWFRPRRGTALQAYEYCTKAGRLDGPWEQGVRSRPGYRTDIESAVETYVKEGPRAAAQQHTQTMVINGRGVEKVANMLFEPFRRDVKFYILYGQSGTGKTEYFERKYGYSDVYRLPKSHNLKWFGSYSREPYLQIDEFKGKAHVDDPSTLHTILDARTLQHEAKGGHVWGVWHTVIITTNVHPRRWFDWDKTESWEPFVRRITQFWIWHKDGIVGVREPDRQLTCGSEEFVKEFEF